jgi:hypothetical protein
MLVPLQTVVLAGTVTVGVGLTVIVYEEGTPGQPPAADGVTVMVAVTGLAVAFVPVNAGVFPVPLAASPIDGSELVHAKVAPVLGLVKADAAIGEPLQTVMLAGTTTLGAVFTVMV